MLVTQFLHGYMVLLYHLYANTHYTVRGGHSGSGTVCGALFVVANSTNNVTGWTVGAALSFICIYTLCLS